MKKQFHLSTSGGRQVWYLDTEDRSDDVLSMKLSMYQLVWHRLNGSAYIDENGSQEWWMHDSRHRGDGPAIINASGYQAWWVNDELYCDNKSFQQAAGITDEEMMIMIIKYGDVK